MGMWISPSMYVCGTPRFVIGVGDDGRDLRSGLWVWVCGEKIRRYAFVKVSWYCRDFQHDSDMELHFCRGGGEES